MSSDRRAARVHIQATSKIFPETGLIVDGLDLTISPGEFVSLLGPSGCGKSTLLRLIANLDRPEKGEILVESSEKSHFRGFVFQEAQLLPWRNALRNAALPLELMGRSRAEAEQMAKEALVKVGLGDALTRYPNQLSGGMKMRVSVARALVTRPSLLLLDEPFAALDEQTRHRLQEDLRAVWQESGMTVVFVTHSVSEAVFLSDRAVVFSARPARVLLDHKIELPRSRAPALRSDPELSRVYLQEIARVAAAYPKDEGTP